MKRISKLCIICIMLLVFILVTTTVSLAENEVLDINNILQDTENIQDIQEEKPEDSVQQNSATENTNSENNSSKTENQVNNVTNDKKLPQTGEMENYAIIFLVIIFGISSIYAYKKIKNYNIK